MDQGEYLFFAVFGGIVLYLLYRIQKFGFKGAFFGARIVREVGEVQSAPIWLVNQKLRVHLLEADQPNRAIGLELTQTAFMSWSMTPIALSLEESKKLISILQTAVNERERVH